MHVALPVFLALIAPHFKQVSHVCVIQPQAARKCVPLTQCLAVEEVCDAGVVVLRDYIFGMAGSE